MFVLNQKKDQIIEMENGIISIQFGTIYATSDGGTQMELGEYPEDIIRVKDILKDIIKSKSNDNAAYEIT